MRIVSCISLISLLIVNLISTAPLHAQDESVHSPLSCLASFLDLTFEELEAREQTAVTGIAKLTLKLETGKIAYDTVEDVKNHLINSRFELRERLILNYFINSLTADNSVALNTHVDSLIANLIRFEIYKIQGRDAELKATHDEIRENQLAELEAEQQRLIEHARLQREYDELKGSDELPLIAAVRSGDIERFKKLLTNPYSNPVEMDTHGYTPLHLAAINGHKEILKLIFNTPGFKFEWLVIQNDAGNTPLHLAAIYGRTEILKLILNTPGFKPEWLEIQANDGNTPLHLAARNGNTGIVRMLEEKAKELESSKRGKGP